MIFELTVEQTNRNDTGNEDTGAFKSPDNLYLIAQMM